MKIYLAGYISGHKLDECKAWRKKVREHYMMKAWDITWLDPMNGKNFSTIAMDGIKSDLDPNAVIHRDFASVMAADLIVVNMDTFGETRPLTGTICELAWAWEHHKPIIMISDSPMYTEHPFTRYFASMIFPTVDKMLEAKAVNYFFKGQVNAAYD